jgi:hypothetical protein
MPDEPRVGEIVETCTTDFTAQCYELFEAPPLGALVKTRAGAVPGPSGEESCIFGIVYRVSMAGLEPGRRPIARGKDELNEDEIYRSNPQLTKLLTSEFNVLVTGCRRDGKVSQFLPPAPARIHGFVYSCAPAEIQQFSRSFDFLNILLKSRLDIPAEELVVAALQQISRAYGLEKRAFLVAAGRELAALLSADYAQLKAILRGLKDDAT